MKKYVCDVCGWEYDEAVGAEDLGIAPGTKFEELPEDFVVNSANFIIKGICPKCKHKK